MCSVVVTYMQPPTFSNVNRALFMPVGEGEAALGADPAMWRHTADPSATTLGCLEFCRRRKLKGLGLLPGWGTKRGVTRAGTDRQAAHGRKRFGVETRGKKEK
jgi:hypothetical protein